MRQPKDVHCWNCGEYIGHYVAYSRDRDTCGKPECSREAGLAEREEREAAHEELDRNMGWSR